MVHPLLVALGIEGLGLVYQKVIKGHPMKCTCNTCVAIEVSIPVTLSLTVATCQK